MRFRFTKHARGKFKKIAKTGIDVTEKQVKRTVRLPIKLEDRADGTYIAMRLLDESHVLRVVYRIEDSVRVVITFYPGRRKQYGI